MASARIASQSTVTTELACPASDRGSKLPLGGHRTANRPSAPPPKASSAGARRPAPPRRSAAPSTPAHRYSAPHFTLVASCKYCTCSGSGVAALASAPTRYLAAGRWSSWDDASDDDILAALRRMQQADNMGQNLVFAATRALTTLTFFSIPDHWSMTGYPGPMPL